MTYHISGRYLLFPVSEKSKMKKINISFDNGRCVTIKARLSVSSPDHTLHYDISPYRGESLSLTVSPDMPFVPAFSDIAYDPEAGKEPHRPRLHFTAPEGWINDPNGLIFHNGVYHLFYQHNPVDTCWNNMHWGHAVSADLFHWQNEGEALYPDSHGTMYSGSATERAGEEGFFLYYTAAGQQYTQHICHIDKNGVAKKCGEVLGCIERTNRDPKVIWDRFHSRYIMALYLKDDLFALFSSQDGNGFVKIQQIHLTGDAECPDFYPMLANGDRTCVKWVFSGASDCYLIGDFDGETFTPETEVQKLSWGHGYAAQTFSGLPIDECRRISWNRYKIKGERFNCQMTVPCRLSLHSDKARGHFLTILPAPELDGLAIGAPEIGEGTELTFTAETSPYRLDITFLAEPTGNTELTVFGMQTHFDFENREFSCGDTRAPLFPGDEGQPYTATAIIDRMGIEWFLADGKQMIVAGDIADNDLCSATLTSSAPVRVSLQKLSDIYRRELP